MAAIIRRANLALRSDRRAMNEYRETAAAFHGNDQKQHRFF